MKDNHYISPSAADNLGIGLFKYSLSPQERFITVNSALVKMLAHSSKEDLAERRLSDLFFHGHGKDEFIALLQKTGKVDFFQAILKDKAGKAVWTAITASRVEGENRALYLEGIIEDISGHKETEEKLAMERDFLQSLLDNMPDAIYFKDLDNRIVKVNKFYAEGAGLKPEEIVGKTDFDFFPPEQAQKMCDDDNQVLATGKPIVGKIERTILRNGTWNQVITTKVPMYDRQGKVIGTMGITRDMTAYANMERERLAMLINGLEVLGKALEMRDPYTYSHNHNVAIITEKIGRALGWDENRILGIRLAGEFHDLGKISIPLDILNKPGKLSDVEYKLVQGHVDNCYDLIKDIEFPFSLAETIYQHHERLDGSGYPRKLNKEEVIIEARILAVSDVLESMTSYRPYRQALGLDKAMEELSRGSGTLYDSQVVDTVFSLIHDSGKKPFWLSN